MREFLTFYKWRQTENEIEYENEIVFHFKITIRPIPHLNINNLMIKLLII